MSRAKKIVAIVVVALFASVIAAPWVLHVILGDEVASEQQGGLVEKRDPTEWPNRLSNDVFSKIEKYFEDRAPFRNSLIAFENEFSQVYETFYRKTITPWLVEIFMPQPEEEELEEMTKEETTEEETPEETTKELESGESICVHVFDEGTMLKEMDCTNDGEQLYTCQKCGETKSETIKASHQFKLKRESVADKDHYGYKLFECERCLCRELTELKEKTIGKEYLVPQIENNALYGRNDWLFYTGDRSLEDYQGTNLMTEAQMAEWKNILNILQAVCDARGIKLVVMVLPNKESVYSEYMPTFQIASQKSSAQLFAEHMQANSDVAYVYPLKELLDAKIYYDVYYKQDTHWNDVGGFIGTMALYRTLGMPEEDILDLNVTAKDHQGGDISNMCGFSSAYQTYTVEYKPEIEFAKDTILHKGEVICGHSNAQTDKDIVIIGDSFRIAIYDYVCRDFATAIHAHRQYMYESVVTDALDRLEEGDVLVVEAVERYDEQNVALAGHLAELLR